MNNNTPTLVDRLRGIYRIPITDCLGPVTGSEEPNNPNEFVRTFETSSIDHEAADRIEELEQRIKDLEEKIALQELSLAFFEHLCHPR